jgi:hypothetical protein
MTLVATASEMVERFHDSAFGGECVFDGQYVGFHLFPAFDNNISRGQSLQTDGLDGYERGTTWLLDILAEHNTTL